MQACVLNADFTVHQIISLQDAVLLSQRQRDGKSVAVVLKRSETVLRGSELAPEILYLVKYVRKAYPKSISWSARNMKIRDHLTCRYCGVSAHESELTIDHLIPRSKNGLSTWENTVTACQPCNAAKGDRLLSDTSLSLIGKSPTQPTVMEFFQTLQTIDTKMLTAKSSEKKKNVWTKKVREFFESEAYQLNATQS